VQKRDPKGAFLQGKKRLLGGGVQGKEKRLGGDFFLRMPSKKKTPAVGKNLEKKKGRDCNTSLRKRGTRMT